MSQLPNRNGDLLIQSMLSDLHGFSYAPQDFTIDEIAPTTKGGRDTAITITFNSGPYSGKTITFYYNRLHMTYLVGARCPELPNSGAFVSTVDLVAAINTSLSLYLTDADIINEPLSLDTLPTTVTIKASPTSRVIKGSCEITIVSAGENVGGAPFLFGFHNLTNSQEETFRLFGFDTLEGVTGEISGYNGSVEGHHFSYDSVGGIPTAAGVAFLGSTKYASETEHPTFVVGFQVSDTGVTKITGEMPMGDAPTGSSPRVAVDENGRVFAAEVGWRSTAGALTLKAGQIVGDAVVQVGNTFTDALGDVGMTYQSQGIKVAGVIDNHFIIGYKLEGGATGNINFRAYSFDGTDFALERSWTAPGNQNGALRISNGRIILTPSSGIITVYDYTAAAGPTVVISQDLKTQTMTGIYTDFMFSTYDEVTHTVWITLYDDTYANCGLAPFKANFATQTFEALPAFSGLDDAMANPEVAHNNFLFGYNAGWSGRSTRFYNGTTLTELPDTYSLPPGTVLVLPITQAPA